MSTDPTPLVETWRSDAAILRRRLGDHDSAASVLESCAAEIEAWWRQRRLELLSPAEASELSGYTEDGLRRLVERGDLSDVKEGRSRLYRAGELPRHARRLETVEEVEDLATTVIRSRARKRRNGGPTGPPG